MIRDTFFSMSRFVSLCRKEMIESWKVNLLRFVMMYGILTIIFVWNGYFEYHNPGWVIDKGTAHDPCWEFVLVIFLWALVIMGILSASFTMERMKTRTSRTTMLMTPATMFEKFFSRWLVFTFGFFIVYLIAFKLADWTRVAVYTVSYPELKEIIATTPLSYLVGNDRYAGEAIMWRVFEDYESFMLAVSGYLFVQSLFVLGSTVWPKNSFIKTFSALMLIIILFMGVQVAMRHILFAGKNGFFDASVIFSREAIEIYLTLFFFALAIFNWVVAYFRFKESEIINRW